MALNINKRLRLPTAEYFAVANEKTGIAIHHTVGGSAESTFNWWKDEEERVGTAYIIDRDGTILEVFNPEAWAWQFGLGWPYAAKIKFEKRFIGIEIASEGGLKESGGNLYCFDRVSDRTLKNRQEAFDYGSKYRGYRYFDKYEEAQLDSLLELIEHLCSEFNIKRQIPEKPLDYHGDKLVKFEGIIGHAMIRKDKSDPAPDETLWNRIVNSCNINKKEIEAPISTRKTMTNEEIDQLFEHNVQELNKMQLVAGSMVKGLIMELERNNRNTYIKLQNAVPGGHAVDYTFVQGDKSLVGRIARALGFKSVTDSRLEVQSA